jgi:hypothetical protein
LRSASAPTKAGQTGFTGGCANHKHWAEAAHASEAEKWRHLTLSTVFEDAESIPELLNH